MFDGKVFYVCVNITLGSVYTIHIMRIFRIQPNRAVTHVAYWEVVVFESLDHIGSKFVLFSIW